MHGERELLIDQPYFRWVGFEQRVHLMDGAGAVGAFEIRKFDEGDAGVGGSFGRGAGDRDRSLDGVLEDLSFGRSFGERRGFEIVEHLIHVLAFADGSDNYFGETGAESATRIFDPALGDFHAAGAGTVLLAEDFEDGGLLTGREALRVDAGQIGRGLPVDGRLGQEESGGGGEETGSEEKGH